MVFAIDEDRPFGAVNFTIAEAFLHGTIFTDGIFLFICRITKLPYAISKNILPFLILVDDAKLPVLNGQAITYCRKDFVFFHIIKQISLLLLLRHFSLPPLFRKYAFRMQFLVHAAS